jgi:peptidyl-prolyl cis-trans isomerase D
MLLAINDRIKGWLGIAVVILIALPFALWGIQEYFSDSGPRYAAKVNGSEITLLEFERTVSMQRQRLLQQNQGQMPFTDKVLRETTLNQLINQRLLEDVTYDAGYRISDTLLSQEIKQLFTIDGNFDRIRFEATVAQLGMSVPGYEQTLRNELRVKQMQAAIANTSFVTNQEAQRLASLENQTRDFTVLTFNLDHFSTAGDPTDDEIAEYYELNKANFMRPEKIKVDYVELTSENIAHDVAVDEAQLQQMYDHYLQDIANNEERKASHILIKNTGDGKAYDSIMEIRQKVVAGEDFSALAKTYSEDPGSAQNGGDLGWVALGDMVKPFEKALFELNNGDISDIVETQFGYHIIKLEDIRKEEPVPFGVKRYEFEEQYKSEVVASEFYDLSERLAALAYENPDNLEIIKEQMGLDIKSSDYFTRAAGRGIADNSKVRDIAFSPLVLEDGNNSDIIELSPEHVIVIRLHEHVPATAQPLQEVRSKIENIIRAEKGHQQTLQAALDAKTRLEQGEAIDSVTGDGIKLDKFTAVSKKDRQKVNDPQILTEAFSMQAKSEGEPEIRQVDLFSGDVALVVLDKVNLPPGMSSDDIDSVRSEIIRDDATRDFSAVLLAIKNSADIERNKRVIDR